MDPSCHFPRSLSGTLAQSPGPAAGRPRGRPRRARCHDSARALSRAITERASALDRCHVRSPSARRRSIAVTCDHRAHVDARSLSRASLVRRGDRSSSRASTGEHRSLVASRDLGSRASIDHHAHASERRSARTAPALARGATSRLACERRDHRRRARRRSARPHRRTRGARLAGGVGRIPTCRSLGDRVVRPNVASPSRPALPRQAPT